MGVGRLCSLNARTVTSDSLQPPTLGRTKIQLRRRRKMKDMAWKFLLLLLLYIPLIILLASSDFVNDEASYATFATQLAQGIQSYGKMTLWWGPGYPLVLTPFVLLNLPWLAAKLLNALFLVGAIVYLYKTLSLYVDTKYATIITLILAVYPPLFRLA